MTRDELEPIQVPVLPAISSKAEKAFTMFYLHLLEAEEYWTNENWGKACVNMGLLKNHQAVKHLTSELHKAGYTVRPKGSKTEQITGRGLRKLRNMGVVPATQLPLVPRTEQLELKPAGGL